MGIPVITSEIAKNIYAVRTGISNFYVIDTGSGLVSFDTGINSFLASNGLKKLNLDPKKFTDIFLTHSDYDHVGGLNIFENAEIHISAEEEKMINGSKARLLIKYNKIKKPYSTLRDREIRRIGDCEIQIIFTPGHTLGSACYLVNNKILISGDALLVSKSGGVSPFMFFIDMNHIEAKKSLKNIIDEGIISKSDLILTGHSGIFKR